MHEFDLIEKYFAPLAGPEGLGLKDDAAHFSAPSGFDIILTTDTMVEGVHFPKGEHGALVAERLLRVNLSDLAAKAARPRGYLLSIAWPKYLSTSLIANFASGLKDAQDAFGIKLWGGDTVAINGPAVFTATLIGLCPESLSAKRMGSKPGDDIWLTGQVGKGYAGLEYLNMHKKALEYFYRPAPRLELRKILQTWASAALDVSDGFAADLGHLADASKVRMSVQMEQILWPGIMTAEQCSDHGLQETMLTHGDDYEIIFTAHPDYRDNIEAAAKDLPFVVSRIGRCDFGSGVEITRGGSAITLSQKGYQHF